MQLTKLLTLSQFIDLVQSLDVTSENVDTIFHQNLGLIYRYNNFLKQPLTKGMFVGDEAIFLGWKKSIYYNYQVNHPNGIDCISFSNSDFPVYYFSGCDLVVHTLTFLAELYEGTLTLKNVEI